MLLAAILSASAQDYPYGRFIGDVKTKWLEDGRRMQLLESLSYVDQRGTIWDAPKDWIIDGASIPRFAWSFTGGPYEKKYRSASVIHDVACDQKKRTWEEVHEAFYNAMRASGVEARLARIMYGAVYHFGPRWAYTVTEYVPEKDVASRTDAIRLQFDRRSSMNVSLEEHYVMGLGASGAVEKISTGLKKLTVAVSPEPAGMANEKFEKMRAAIEQQDLSLEEIRNFAPK
jgi:hypothetical protein